MTKSPHFVLEALKAGLITSAEKGRLPDFLLRYGIRQLCKERLEELQESEQSDSNARERYIESLRGSAIAHSTQAANDQHYELPPEFFEHVLGPNRKYSCGYYPSSTASLETAEEESLRLTIEHAELKDGMRILELGCGWGSLTLAMARAFPRSKIVAISNSAPQRRSILERAKTLGFSHVEVLTHDVATGLPSILQATPFDRVVSVEMFEHMSNYERLFSEIASLLQSNGKLFVHIFNHRHYAYPYQTEGAGNWMGRYFFTGGQMPSRDLFRSFDRDLRIEAQWDWDGTHYARTAEDWLKNLDQKKKIILPILERTYGRQDAKLWYQRWRIFFMACAELFAYHQGQEWGVSHYRFAKVK